ncbi:MAG: glutamate--tRNA ligase, partial [Spiribacter sp.]|nr:glutamate--tRNA ligase [Spiribacter sp.]
EALSALESWEASELHNAVIGVAEEHDLKLGKVAQPIRVAVSGGPVSPPIDQTLELLGRKVSLSRIAAAHEWALQASET